MTSACCWKLPANNWLLTKSAAGDRYIKRVVKAIGEKARRRGSAGVACDPLDLQSRRWTAVHFIPFIRVKVTLMRKIEATSVNFKPFRFNRFLVRAVYNRHLILSEGGNVSRTTAERSSRYRWLKISCVLLFYIGFKTAWVYDTEKDDDDGNIIFPHATCARAKYIDDIE